jgi:hypothetical protein
MLSRGFLAAILWPSLTEALLDLVDIPAATSTNKKTIVIELKASVTHTGISSMEFYQMSDINPFWVLRDPMIR